MASTQEKAGKAASDEARPCPGWEEGSHGKAG